jgi:hypothetical protein
MDVPRGAVEIVEGVFLEDAGRVHQQGDRTKLGLGFADEGDGGGFVAEVAGQEGRASAARADVAGGGLGFLVEGAGVDGDVVAGVSGGAGQGAPDPAGGARDQGRAAGGHQSSRPNSKKFSAPMTTMKRAMAAMPDMDGS